MTDRQRDIETLFRCGMEGAEIPTELLERYVDLVPARDERGRVTFDAMADRLVALINDAIEMLDREEAECSKS